MTKSNTKTTNKTENGANRKSKLTELTNRPPSGRRDLAPQRVRGQGDSGGMVKREIFMKRAGTDRQKEGSVGGRMTGRKTTKVPGGTDRGRSWGQEEMGDAPEPSREMAMVEPMEGGAIEEKRADEYRGQLDIGGAGGRGAQLETESP